MERVIVNPQIIDWENDDNYLIGHPLEKIDSHLLNQSSLKSHIFIMTSGSKQKKCAALSKEAFLNSAEAVNHHLNVQKEDRWLVCLPLFHVGGLSILARSFLSQSNYFILKEKWNTKTFISQLNLNKITLTSLVPTQVYDLVVDNIEAPLSLRAVVVGGGSLAPDLYYKARKLRWPLIPSYGLTEACSQVATADLESLNSLEYPLLKILEHCKVQIIGGQISLQSSSLLTGWYSFSLEKKVDLKKDRSKIQMNLCGENYLTEDKGSIIGSFLKVEGRSQVIKIKGHNVSLFKLKSILVQVCLDQQLRKKYYLIATPHLRTAYQIDLVTDEQSLSRIQRLTSHFNSQVLPFEQICNCYVFLKIPQGEIKVQFSHLKTQLGLSKGII